MKKVYITVILFVSLFFFCSNGANAATYNLKYSDNQLALINNDFIHIKDLAINLSNEIGKKYFVILQHKSSNTYHVHFFNEPFTQTIRVVASSLRISIQGVSGTNNIYVYDYIDNNLIFNSSTLVSFTVEVKLDVETNYLYSNFDIFNYSEHVFNISYKDYNYTIESNAKILSLYEHYLAINGLTDEDFQPDIHKEEKTILSNFYTLVIEKINLLANSIINNYIYLTVIGIFILIFVICLIRRYLL